MVSIYKAGKNLDKSSHFEGVAAVFGTLGFECGEGFDNSNDTYCVK